jgi:hypothetical protein
VIFHFIYFDFGFLLRLFPVVIPAKKRPTVAFLHFLNPPALVTK